MSSQDLEARKFAAHGVTDPTELLSRSDLSPKVREFIQMAVKLCKPARVYICDGSDEEYTSLMQAVVNTGAARLLNPQKRPNSYIVWTDPLDVARSEKDTYICSINKKDAGPTNNWCDPSKKRAELNSLFDGCMQGRTMYVIPFAMGHLDSPFTKMGIEISDAAYVAASMKVMTRMGKEVLKRITDQFVPCMHSVGQPLLDNEKTNPAQFKAARASWPCNIAHRNVCHFPESREIWSFGSGYGGNSLLGKKCFALRIASVQARDEGWLAEHMLIMGVTNPAGVKKYVVAAFPSACGKTNLAMMQPSLPGWKVETVGDDIAWMRFGPDGRLYAVNPEFGFFGVAPGTSTKSNPNALIACQSNSLFTNVGMTEDGDVYWEGMDVLPSGVLTDWKRRAHWMPTLTPDFKGGHKINDKIDPCAQPNSRFTAPIVQCPVLDSEWNNPQGVPISAVLFGGRRDDTMPLVFQSKGWDYGTYFGGVMRSFATSASDQVGLVNDPMAMKPFIGYNVKDYWAHWLDMGKTGGDKMPKIFHVNWFQKDDAGKFMWPGFGENARVIEWVLGRCDGTSDAKETPIGYVPTPESLNTAGLGLSEDVVLRLTAVEKDKWVAEVDAAKAFLSSLMPGDAAVPVPPRFLEINEELRSSFSA